MKKILLLTFILTISSMLFAQDNSCKNKSINDSEKRSFTEPNTFSFDVDGDGKTDEITQRTYKVKAAGKSKVKETHWITFDLKTNRGKQLKSFFKYKYGDNLADYWVYALLPCKIHAGKQTDLIFYTGDDSSDERIILKNSGNSFKIYSRKASDY